MVYAATVLKVVIVVITVASVVSNISATISIGTRDDPGSDDDKDT